MGMSGLRGKRVNNMEIQSCFCATQEIPHELQKLIVPPCGIRDTLARYLNEIYWLAVRLSMQTISYDCNHLLLSPLDE